MKQVGGVWLPSHETHLPGWMTAKNEVVGGKLTYQHHKLVAALKFVHGWGVAVDVGAHCGLWSMHLVQRFAKLVAFEPVELHRQCFARNVVQVGADADPYTLHACALGEADGMVSMHHTPGSSGDTWVEGTGDTPMRRLDDVLGADVQVDFIKLDCEGYELFALRGGEQMLQRCHPCVIVEQKPGKAQQFGLGETDAVTYLRDMGAHLRTVMSGDYILSWDR